MFCISSLILPSLSQPPFESTAQKRHIQNLRECMHFTFFVPSAFTMAFYNSNAEPNAVTTHEYWNSLYTTYKGPHSECLAAYNHFEAIRPIFDKIHPILEGYKNRCDPKCTKLSLSEYMKRKRVFTNFTKEFEALTKNIKGAYPHHEDNLEKNEERREKRKEKSSEEQVKMIIKEEKEANQQLF